MSDGTHIPRPLQISRNDWAAMWAAYYKKDDGVMKDLAWANFRIPPTLAMRYMTRLSKQSEDDAPRARGAKYDKKPTRLEFELASNAKFLGLHQVRQALPEIHEFATAMWREGPWGVANRIPEGREAEAQHLVWALLRVIGFDVAHIARMEDDFILAKVMEAAVMPVIYDMNGPIST